MKALWILAVLLFLGTSMGYAEEEIPLSVHPVRGQIEDAKATYNESMAELESQFVAGDLTKDEYISAILTANDALAAEVATLKASLPEETA